MTTTPDHTGVVYLLIESTGASRKLVGVFTTIRDHDAWTAANPSRPNVIRETQVVALYGDVTRIAGPQRGGGK